MDKTSTTTPRRCLGRLVTVGRLAVYSYLLRLPRHRLGAGGAGQTKATMAVPPFQNRSMQVGLETVFANDIIRALQDRKIVQVKPGEVKADYVLLGSIKKLEHSSTAYLDIDQSLIRRTTLTVEVIVKDMRTNKTVWKDVEIVNSDYVANQYHGIGEATRDQGIREASTRLAQRITDKISVLF